MWPIGVSEEERFGRESARRVISSVQVVLRAAMEAESSLRRCASAFREARSVSVGSDAASLFSVGVRAAMESFAIVFSSCLMRERGALRFWSS